MTTIFWPDGLRVQRAEDPADAADGPGSEREFDHAPVKRLASMLDGHLSRPGRCAVAPIQSVVDRCHGVWAPSSATTLTRLPSRTTRAVVL